MKKIFSLLFFWIHISGILAQPITQTVRGSVVDKGSQTPLPGVAVQVLNTEPLLGAISDENGQFKIPNVPVGRWQLKFQLVSYKEKYMTIILNSGKESVSTIELEEHVVEAE